LELSSEQAQQMMLAELTELPKLRFRAADVQAAMTVLGRRDLSNNQDDRLAFGRVDLRRADLRHLNFSRADLYGVNLQKAWMDGVQLERTTLRLAQLQWAYLPGAILRNADLRWADLYGAQLDGADFMGARANGATRWPNGFDWRAAGVVIEQGELAPESSVDRQSESAAGLPTSSAEEMPIVGS
jgi:uncharacterized protein YjbI with pentapeptide repeats